ncbi:hypothetical protein D3C71_2160670 [compost metagenome]
MAGCELGGAALHHADAMRLHHRHAMLLLVVANAFAALEPGVDRLEKASVDGIQIAAQGFEDLVCMRRRGRLN